MKRLTIFIVLTIFIQSSASAQFGEPCLPEGITFTTQEQIDNFQTNYPNCTEIEGDIEIYGDDITNLNGLDVVTSIGGHLLINYNDALISLSGLDNLTSIGEDSLGKGLAIVNNYALTSLTGLDNLSSIEGGLHIAGTNILTSLSGLEGLTSIEGSLGISSNSALISLSGLNNVTYVGGELTIGPYSHPGTGNPALTSLTGLEGLSSIGESLRVENNDALLSISGLGNVTSIGGNIQISDSPVLTSLIGLEGLNTIIGSLWIGGNGVLVNLRGLDKVTSIGGGLSIVGHDALISLSGLDNLTSIGGDLKIEDNDTLTSLAGLNNIDASSIKDLTINYNTSLSTCEVQSICNYLSNPNGHIEIYYNAPGCNNQDEVEYACAVSVDEDHISGKLSIYPNPSSSQITIELPNVPQNNAVLTIYNMSAHQMLTSKITAQKTVVDISGLPKGIYFVKVANDKTIKVGKLMRN